jgi:hypothetical protein
VSGETRESKEARMEDVLEGLILAKKYTGLSYRLDITLPPKQNLVIYKLKTVNTGLVEWLKW